MTVKDATFELRQIAGKSQQVMATELGMATKSLQLYETGQRVPESGKLLRLLVYARTHAPDRDDIYEVFYTAFMKQVQSPGWNVTITLIPKKGKK